MTNMTTDLDERRRLERERYEYIYANKPFPYPGDHWAGALSLMSEVGVSRTSFCDVGTGLGEFPKYAWLHWSRCQKCYGVDFALPPERGELYRNGEREYAIWAASAHCPGLKDEEVEWITAFDLLEHLWEDEVDLAIKEWARVARRGLVVSICYQPSSLQINGEGLHRTVKPESWWVPRIVDLTGWGLQRRQGRYLVFGGPKHALR